MEACGIAARACAPFVPLPALLALSAFALLRSAAQSGHVYSSLASVISHVADEALQLPRGAALDSFVAMAALAFCTSWLAPAAGAGAGALYAPCAAWCALLLVSSAQVPLLFPPRLPPTPEEQSLGYEDEGGVSRRWRMVAIAVAEALVCAAGVAWMQWAAAPAAACVGCCALVGAVYAPARGCVRARERAWR